MWNKKLTCNQLMLLLSAYRGTREQEFQIGTERNDFIYLQRIGFIDENGGITKKGEDRVRSAMGIFRTDEQLRQTAKDPTRSSFTAEP